MMESIRRKSKMVDMGPYGKTAQSIAGEAVKNGKAIRSFRPSVVIALLNDVYLRYSSEAFQLLHSFYQYLKASSSLSNY